MNGEVGSEPALDVEQAFDQFFTALTCKSILSSFHQLVDICGLRHADHHNFYSRLKEQLGTSWKAQALWAKLDKRASHRDYGHGKVCSDTRVLIIGSGPCGLRTAIECAFLGARAVIVEKRDRFSRNNVLHLWPYLITDLKNLGAKLFCGKFCAGSIDHISIRQLQCILLKVALLVGVEVHVNVSFDGLIEPSEDGSLGWRCKCTPGDHPLSEYQFDVLVGADGKRNTLPGFKRKEFRGKLAIAVTANFINRNTNAEARVEEISGVAFIFNQKFFLDLKEKTGIDLENIVYYKDDTHYFVMTAKKQSLLDKGVLIQDHADTITLLDRSNVNQEALMDYAREAADFSTNYELPALDYAVNHYGQADVAMFDFTSMFAAENASRVMEKHRQRLLMGLVGDSLLEPFWPTGSGCARGFLGAFDAAWMIRSWASGRMTPLQVIAERESIFTLLSQTTPDRLHKNHHQYSIDPNTRYPNLNVLCVKPRQVVHLYDGVIDPKELEEVSVEVPAKRPYGAHTNEYNIDSYSLLRWCQRVLNTGVYRGVHIVDFTSSWRSGLAFCALIHAFRPELLNVNSLMECEIIKNNQLAFDVAQKELGVAPVMSGEDMASCDVPDKLTMVAYLSQFYELFRLQPLPSTIPVRPRTKNPSGDDKSKSSRSPSHKVSLLNKISARINKTKKRKEKEDGEESPFGSKKARDEYHEPVELTKFTKLPMDEIANRLQLDRKPGSIKDKTGKPGDAGSVSVTAMAEVLVAKFKSNAEQPAPLPVRRMKGHPVLPAAQPASEFCYFCQKRVYIMERLSAEGVFFHRHCLKCDFCSVGLRVNSYSCERLPSDGVKFYCYRHALPELRVSGKRKRDLNKDRNLNCMDNVKENIPDTVITPPEEIPDEPHVECITPKRKIPAPLQVPEEPREKAKKTPERVEFEISFDGQEEESEEEQFEHNMRDSMSSDSILDNTDDDDSDADRVRLETFKSQASEVVPLPLQHELDGYVSESEVARILDECELDGYVSESEVARILDEWSSAEEDVWELARDSLTTQGHPLTLEEAFQLKNNWKRQHSKENLLDTQEYSQQPDQRLLHGAYTRLHADNEDDDEGSSTEVEESEYETGDSTDDELTEEESEMTRGASTADTLEGGGTEESAATTTTSPSSPAMKNAARASFFSAPPTVVRLDPWRMFSRSKTEEVAEETKKEQDSSAEVVHKEGEGQLLESRDGEEENRDTDVSESLEMDSHKSRSPTPSSKASLEDLVDEMSRKAASDEVEEMEVVELAVEEPRAGREERESDLVKDEAAEAMEKMLLDIDHNCSADGGSLHLSGSATDLDGSVSAEEDVFQQGEVQEAEDRCANGERVSKKSTDVDIKSAGGMENGASCHSDKKAASENTEEPGLPRVQESEGRIGTSGDDCQQRDLQRTPSENTEESVLRSVQEMGDTLTSTSGDDTLQQVLQEVAAMSDLSDTELRLNQQFQELDERFVTDRKKSRKKKGSSSVQPGSQSSPSISTLSGTASSSSSSSSLDDMVRYNEQLLTSGEANDLRPDEEMLQDYKLTMSLVLDESFSDAEADNSMAWKPLSSLVDELDETLKKKDEDSKPDELNTTGASSTYYTPQTSVEDRQEEKKTTSSVSKMVSADDVKVKLAPASKGRDLQKPKAAARSASKHQPPKKVDSAGKARKAGHSGRTVLETSKAPVPQARQKAPAAIPRKAVSTASSRKTVTPKPTKPLSPHTKGKTTPSITSDSVRPRTASSASQSAKRVSGIASSSSHSSAVRPLPRPNVSKRAASSASKDSISSTSASVSSKAVAEGNANSSISQINGAKTKITVDKGALWSDSSTDHHSSDSEFRRKKIPVDLSVCALPQPESSHIPSVISDIEDIPFADESEVDEIFYTPSTSVKTKPAINAVEQQLVQEKIKFKAAADGQRKGLVKPVDRKAGGPLQSHPRGSSSNNTSSTPDLVSDSDENLYRANGSTTASATSSTSERGPSVSLSKGKDKDKKRKGREKVRVSNAASAGAKSKVKLRKADDGSEGEKDSKKEKRRSLLDMLRPNKSPEKHKSSRGRDPMATPTHSDASATSLTSASKHKKEHKSQEGLEGALSSELQGLQISVFDKSGKTETSSRLGSFKDHNYPLPIAPKASVDEFSDSDESLMSVSTLLRRMDTLSENIDERVARKLQRVAIRQQKRAEQQRLRAAQEIQRRLQEVEERQRELEDRGIAVEKALRGEGPEADVDENQLMGEWFSLVHEKNALVRYESELMVKAKELELEDRQARLQQEFRHRSLRPEVAKSPEDIEEEGQLLDELLDVVEQRNALVAMLEEERLREQQEDRELEDMMVKKGFVLSPLNYSRHLRAGADIESETASSQT